MRLGFWEIVVVLVVALVLFGPSRLPEMGRSLGKAIREFRQATSDLGNELSQAQQALDIDKPAAKPAAKRDTSESSEGEAPEPAADEAEPAEKTVEAVDPEQADEQRREPV